MEKCVTVKSTSQAFAASFTAGGLIGPSIMSAKQKVRESWGKRQREKKRQEISE